MKWFSFLFVFVCIYCVLLTATSESISIHWSKYFFKMQLKKFNIFCFLFFYSSPSEAEKKRRKEILVALTALNKFNSIHSISSVASCCLPLLLRSIFIVFVENYKISDRIFIECQSKLERRSFISVLFFLLRVLALLSNRNDTSFKFTAF